jgi:hypothetical protein
MTDIALRLGVFRDRPVFEEMLGAANPIVVPAHIAAYSPDAIWGFLKGVAESHSTTNACYFYDPMTYWIDLEPKYWCGEDGRLPTSVPIDRSKIRPSFLKLLIAYGMLDSVEKRTRPEDVRADFISSAVGPCLDYQRSGSVPKGTKTVNKYAEILGQPIDNSGLTPCRLVAPYFHLADLSMVGVAGQARLNVESLALRRQGEELWAVVALDSATYATVPGNVRTALTLDDFDGVGLWVSGLDEHDASLATLNAYRSLIASIRRPVWLMYGGYFGLLLGPEGVTQVSHGIYYTESKKVRGPVGSGPAPFRYYVPALHRFYPPDSAFRLIEDVPGLACNCRACTGGLASLKAELGALSSPSSKMAWARRLQRHFLACRAAEVAGVNSSKREDLARELKATATTLDTLGRTRTGALEISYGHLRTWAAALGF